MADLNDLIEDLDTPCDDKDIAEHETLVICFTELIFTVKSTHYVVKTRICPIGITRFSVFCAILLASLGVRARLRVLSNTLNDVSQL